MMEESHGWNQAQMVEVLHLVCGEEEAYRNEKILPFLTEIIQTHSSQPLELIEEDDAQGKGVYHLPWTIDNKYYSTKVYFRLQHVSLAFLDKDKENLMSRVKERSPAVLVAFNKNDWTSFKKLQSLPSFGEKNVSLCVGMSGKYLLNRKEDLSAIPSDAIPRETIETFCFSAGYEYVDLEDKIEDPTDKFADRVSVERIMEALSTHVWEEMTMKKREKSGNFVDNYDVDVDLGIDDELEIDMEDIPRKNLQLAKESQQQQDQTPEESQETLLNDIQQLSLKQQEEEQQPSSTSTRKDETKSNLPSSILDDPNRSTAAFLPQIENLFANLDNDDGFEKLLMNMQTLRSMAKDLPDQQRRNMAARVALSFLSKFEDEGDEELGELQLELD